MGQFIRGANPVWFWNNLIGQPVDDTYFAFFLENISPYNFQAVYEDPDGMTPWANPIEFQANAGLPDNIYFDDTLVYRIEIRQGPTRTSPLIGNPIQNYVPGGGGGATEISLLTSENLITNPEFVDTYFGTSLTITTAGTYNIAPGWNLILTGTGTTTVTQGSASPPSSWSPTTGNTPYYLTIDNSGWTTAFLQQTLSNNGGIFTNGAIAIAFSAFATGSGFDLEVDYIPNMGDPTTIHKFPIIVGGFNQYKYAVDTHTPANSTQTGTNGFVNLSFALPVDGELTITNIQLTGQSTQLPSSFNPLTDAPPYQELTYERMVDHEFNVYRNSLVQQSKDTILTGWQFAFNPFQFSPRAPTTITSKCSYVCDQTILYQAGGGSSIIFTKQSFTGAQTAGISLTPVDNETDSRFALIQYIDPSVCSGYWAQVLSSLARLRIFTATNSEIRLKMCVIARADLPPTLSNTDPISSWPANAEPIFAAGWTRYGFMNDPSFTIPQALDPDFGVNAFQALSYDNLQLPPPDASTPTTSMFALVVYTMDNMTSTPGNKDTIAIDRISLVNNNFAVDSNPKTADEVLRECQFYFEQSYDLGVNSSDPTARNTASGARFAMQGATNLTDVPIWFTFATSFSINYSTVKREQVPTITIYAKDGTVNSVYYQVRTNGSFFSEGNKAISLWSALTNGEKSATYAGASNTQFATDSTPIVALEMFLLYHYTIDARLGV